MKIYLKGGRLTFWESPAAYMIQWRTDSYYWHTECELYDDLLIGADFWKGVRESTIRQEVMKFKRDQFYDVYECTEPTDNDKWINFLLSKEGRSYDKLGVFYLAWLKIKNQRDDANKLQREKDYFCSELAVDGMRAAGAVLPDIPKGSIASPKDIAVSRSMKPLYRIKRGSGGGIVKINIPPVFGNS